MRFFKFKKINIIIIMEKTPAVSIAISMGVLGTACAYLAYSYINSKEENMFENSIKENINITPSQSTDLKSTNLNDSAKISKNIIISEK